MLQARLGMYSYRQYVRMVCELVPAALKKKVSYVKSSEVNFLKMLVRAKLKYFTHALHMF